VTLLATIPSLYFAAPAFARRQPNHPPRPNPTASSRPDLVTTKAIVQGCTGNATLTVATYNVENFWDDDAANSGALNYDEYQKNGSNWYSDSMFDVKAQHVAEAVRLAGAPDVIAMQEFESANNAGRSLDLLKPYVESMGYKYFALGQQNPNNPTSVTSAVMSKFPIVKNERLDFFMQESQFTSEVLHEESLSAMNSSARDPQVVTINVQGNPLRIYTGHWKSKRGNADAGDLMRLAVAELIKADIDAQKLANPNLDILVMGDFNAGLNERPLLVGLNSTADKNLMKADVSSDKMYNLWFELPSSERCSYMHSGELQCIDHMLTTSNLFDGKGIDLVEESFQVVGHNGGEAAQKLLKNDGRTPRRWGMSKKNGRTIYTGTGYSDHLPLIATFKIPSLCKAAP
jgi:predicted extracellular nuclease